MSNPNYNIELFSLISKLSNEAKTSLIYALLIQSEQFIITNPIELLKELLKGNK